MKQTQERNVCWPAENHCSHGLLCWSRTPPLCDCDCDVFAGQLWKRTLKLAQMRGCRLLNAHLMQRSTRSLICSICLVGVDLAMSHWLSIPQSPFWQTAFAPSLCDCSLHPSSPCQHAGCPTPTHPSQLCENNPKSDLLSCLLPSKAGVRLRPHLGKRNVFAWAVEKGKTRLNVLRIDS